MASALLASRAEPLWGGERKVYTRKAPNPNPNSKSNNLNPNPNPNLNTSANRGELESVSPGVSDDWANSSSHHHQQHYYNQKETNHGGYVTFNIAAYTKREMKDLKKRLLLELEKVQKLRNRIESTNFQTPKPNKRPRITAMETPAAKAMVAKMMKQCGQILVKLMKHKFSWIFNSPVDVVGLGLHDYNSIIEHPMDLGTVKAKLGKNVYSTPEEFAADVILTFQNAITYNPPGHDVYVMAQKLKASFEKMWGNAYVKYQNERHRLVVIAEQEMKWSADRDGYGNGNGRGVLNEERRPVSIHSPEPVRRPDSMQSIPVSRPMPLQPAAPVERTYPKPKARDLNKRDMTFDEKRRLSESLENLPQEKMDQVVQIMRRKNAALSQNDDEIEVDIEILDKETLWELDRFVSNHKKTMCKAKRQQELEHNLNSAPVEGNKSPGSEMTEALAPEKASNKVVEPVCMDEDIDIGEDIPTNNFPPVEIERDAGYASGGGSSSSGSSSSDTSSSSDSGSSSDSDSDDDEAQSPNHDAKGSPG